MGIFKMRADIKVWGLWGVIFSCLSWTIWALVFWLDPAFDPIGYPHALSWATHGLRESLRLCLLVGSLGIFFYFGVIFKNCIKHIYKFFYKYASKD